MAVDVPRRRVTLLLSERTRGVKESASESSCRLKAEARCASEHTGLFQGWMRFPHSVIYSRLRCSPVLKNCTLPSKEAK